MTTPAQQKTFLLSRCANLLGILKQGEQKMTTFRKSRLLTEIGRIILKLDSIELSIILQSVTLTDSEDDKSDAMY